MSLYQAPDSEVAPDSTTTDNPLQNLLIDPQLLQNPEAGIIPEGEFICHFVYHSDGEGNCCQLTQFQSECYKPPSPCPLVENNPSIMDMRCQKLFQKNT